MKRQRPRGVTAGVVALAGLLGLALATCGEARRLATPADTLAPVRSAPLSSAYRPGIRFDPATLRPGAPVGELVADSVVATRSLIDSAYVGVARFRGQVELSGTTLRHHDPDPRAICFEADSTSAARLPRWLGDERRAWFCFANQAEAARALGSPGAGLRATIVIERFTIHRGFSDEVNSAWLVRLVRPAMQHRPAAGPSRSTSGTTGPTRLWLSETGALSELPPVLLC